MGKFKPVKRVISGLLAVSTLLTFMPLDAYAEELAPAENIYLEENQIDSDILESDVFYIASAMGTFEESNKNHYLLRISRGGECKGASSVNMKIADLSAKYGKDYTVSLLGGGEETENPETNESLVEMIRGEDYEATPLISNEEFSEMAEEDETIKQNTAAAVNEAISFIENEAGLTPAEPADGSETAYIDPLQQARAAFTGVDGEPQRVTASEDTYAQIQKVADVVTGAVVGANLKIDFAEGEDTRYVVIDTIDNDEHDGDRYFYLMLSKPEGTTTISAASSFAGTISDDEETKYSDVSFGEVTVDTENNVVRAEIRREGGINSICDVQLTSEGISARIGRDFSPVDMAVIFPPGMESRTIDIPVCTDYIDDKADFLLKLTATANAEVKTPETTVTLEKTEYSYTGVTQDVEYLAQPESVRSLNTVITDNPINLQNPSNAWNDADFSGNNRWTGSCYQLQPAKSGFINFMYSMFGANPTATCYGFWTSGRPYIHSGVQLDWERSGSCAEIWVTGGEKFYFNDCMYKSKGYFGRSIKDLYYFSPNTENITIGNDGNCRKCNWLNVYSVSPIKRMFQIDLKEPFEDDRLKFLNEDGTYGYYGNSELLELSGAVNTTGNRIYLVYDESFTLNQRTAAGEGYYTYVKALKGWNGETIEDYIDTSATAVSKKLTESYIQENSDQNKNYWNGIDADKTKKLFRYYESDAYMNHTGTKGFYGQLDVHPQFGYKDAVVKVIMPEENYGYLKFSGTDIKVDAGSTQEFTYHRGDIIKVEMKKFDEKDQSIRPVGFAVHAKYNNENEKGWVTDTPIMVYYANDADCYLDMNKRLQYGYYEITPIYGTRETQIKVRVKNTDMEMFDQSYGIFNVPKRKEIMLNGEKYTEYTIYDDTRLGEVYSVTARLKSGNDTKGIIWRTSEEADTDKDYTGEVFYFNSGINSKNNKDITITLSCKDCGRVIPYHDLSGSVSRYIYNIASKQTGQNAAISVEGAAVSCGGSSTITDENGNFRLSPFKGAPDKYVRYVIYVNGACLLREAMLTVTTMEKKQEEDNNAGKSKIALFFQKLFSSKKVYYYEPKIDEGVDRQVTYYNENGEAYEETLRTVSHDVGMQMINTENGGFIENVSIANENNQNGSFSIEVRSLETVKMSVSSSGTQKYIKTVADKSVSGKPTEVEADEKLIGAEFIAVDPVTYKEGKSFKAKLNADTNNYEAEIPLSEVSPGDLLFVNIITDRANTEYAQFNDDGEYVTTKDDADMNRTVYSYINTGYTFVQSPNEPLVLPKQQQLNPLSDITFMELPLLGSVGFSFDFPFVSVSVNRTDVGYRLSIGVGAMQIADKVKEKHMTSYSSTKDEYYKDLFSLDDPLGSFEKGISKAYDTIMDMHDLSASGNENAAANALAAAGSPTWKADVQVGVYFDFALPQYTELISEDQHNDFYFTGVGGYIGVSGGFRLTMYTIIPLIYMPAYFGIELELSGLGYFGAKADMSKPAITYHNAIDASVDFDSHINKYSNELKLSGRVQIYIGVGLNGVLGLRGGGIFNAIGQYEPSELVSDWGAMLEAKAGIWVDMFLFSLPIHISLSKRKFGSFKDYENESISTKPEEQSFSLRKAYTSKDPTWLPNGSKPAVRAVSGNAALMENDIEYRSAFSESTSYTLVSDGYEHADVKLLKLSDGSIFMAFLDTAPGRDALERTILKYSVFKNGNWSDPVAVKDDGTADFQPSICEMDNSRVMISWLSSDPSVDKTGEAADYLSSLEVYTAVIDKDAANPVSELTRLTNDEYYDYLPVSVYDSKTGDRAVYYVKTASDGTAEEMVNSYTNDCVIVYMLCSDPEGDGNKRWLTDYYYDEEAASEEDKQELIENWNGQRFLSSPIPELGIDVPNISDLTATSYNGLAVFAYTIDQDSSNDTTHDKEMFVQFYDFETHKTYVPVRLSNDNLSDAIPQLIRTKYKDKECTMLFWYRNERDVVYVNISELVKEGLNDDGTIKPEFYQDENDSAEDYDDGIERIYHYVQTPSDSSQGYRSMADFKAVVDKDNAYIVWSQYADNTPETEDGAENQKNLSREIFAAALISDDKDPDASEGTDSDKKQIPCAWSNPYRLTYSGACTDEPAVAVDNSGNMMVVYNQYNQTVTDDPDNPLIISDFKLRASYMEPCGAVDAESIEVSNLTPVNGEKVKVDVNIVNNGLTYAEGYTVDLYVQDDKGNRELLSNFDSDEILGAGGKAVCSAEWTAGNSVKDTVFAAEVYEKGGSWTNKSYLESPKLLQRAEYEVSDVSVKQQDNDFILSYNVKNTGNAASDSNDGYKLILTGPYCDTSDYTYEECIFANEPAGGINAGDEKRFNVKLTMPEGVFDKYGFIDCMGIMEDKNNNYRSSGDQVRIIPEKPINLKLNGKILPQTIEINVGDSIDLDISCSPANFNKNLSAEFSVDDTSVAAVIDGRLEALQEGTTYLRGTTGINGTVIPETKIVVVDKRRMIGDVSGNKSIDLYDAVMVAKHMVGNIKLSDEEKEAADVNRDTKIDLYDAIEIAKYLVKKH